MIMQTLQQPEKKKTPNVTAATWESYAADRSVQTRNFILMEYIYIVRCIAARMYTTYKNFAEQDDIISYGTIALMTAIDRYDYKLEIKFETFASIRVRGAIIDYLRKQDWASRNVRRGIKNIEEAYTLLQNSYGRMPTDGEVAMHLGINLEELHETLGKSYSVNILSIEELIANNMSSYLPSDSNSPDRMLEESEFTKMLELAIDQLADKERLIVTLYYYEGLKSKQIAQVLEISESRVSQLHSKSLLKLKIALKDFL